MEVGKTKCLYCNKILIATFECDCEESKENTMFWDKGERKKNEKERDIKQNIQKK